MSDRKLGNFVKPTILSIQQIFKKSHLILPDYQRPYKWDERNVLQLLEDLSLNFQNRGLSCRLGTIVLHNEKGNENIVDGQQRLTTLSLILKALGHPTNFMKQKFNHSISHRNIFNNYQAIVQYFIDYPQLKSTDFKNYILDKCELVCVMLDDLDEAFQFFDSQNSRGKSLEPYDLLKAYHLREIPREYPDLLNLVENWESAVHEDPSLKVIISQTLYRLRQWEKGRNAEWFENKELFVFKGVSSQVEFPYLRSQKAGVALYHAQKQNPLLYAQSFNAPTFQINQTILNGHLFFEYVQYYRELYQKLFKEEVGILANIKIGDESILSHLNYVGCQRTGDRYIRHLFECSILRYYDKFGEDNLEIVVKRALQWAYQLRLEFERVYWGRIEKTVHERDSLLNCINLAEQPIEVSRFMVKRLAAINYEVEGLMSLLGYEDNTNATK